MNSEISVYVNGNTWVELTNWTVKFEQFFGGATTVRGRGTWEGETEAVNIVSHLFDQYDPDFNEQELSALVREYKTDNEQDCALVVYRPVHAGLW